MNTDARYALLRDRLRRIGKDISFFVADGDISKVEITNEETGGVATYHGHRFDSLADSLDTLERLVDGYEAETR